MLILFIVLIYIYTFTVYFYFSNGNFINYKYFMDFIQIVSKDTYFMNYGLWKLPTDTLQIANERLISFILKKSGALQRKNINILDIGCGYGEQDFFWENKLDKTNKITAIDISEYQIEFAKKKCKERKCLIQFERWNAMELIYKFKQRTFDIIFSVESAFHYRNRPYFFNQVSSLLSSSGTFVISDILLQDSYKPTFMSNIFLKIYSDFLHFPKENLIPVSEWKTLLFASGFQKIEFIDITDDTFVPYYTHFVSTYMKHMRMPDIITRQIISFLETTQPFSYMVAVCQAR
jgi:2-polyprenyl-3-methyl-5-hydroxy-6-metoxy-1,4-benzoquinol methylase